MKSLLAYGVGAFVPRLLNMLAVFLFSRLLSVPDFGLYVFTVAIGEFCDWLTSAWFRIAFLRFYHPGRADIADGSFNPRAPLATNLALNVLGAGLAFPIALVLVHQHTLAFAVCTALYVLGSGGAQMALGFFRGEGKPARYAIVEASRFAVSIGAGVIAAMAFGSTYAVCAGAVFGAQAVCGLALCLFLWRRRRARSGSSGRLRDMLRFGGPVIFSGALYAVINAADRSQLQWILGPASVGLYAAATSLARQPLDVLFYALNLGAFTDLVRSYDGEGPQASGRLLGRQLAMMTAIGAPAIVGLAMVGELLLGTFFDRRYSGAEPLIVPIAAAAIISGLRSYGIHQAFHMARRTGLQAVTYIPSVVFTLGAGFFLIHAYGVAGAAYAAFASSVFSFAISLVFALRLLPIAVPWKELVKALVATAFMAASVDLAQRVVADGAPRLVASVGLGALCYGVVLASLDFLGARAKGEAYFRRLRRMVTSAA